MVLHPYHTPPSAMQCGLLQDHSKKPVIVTKVAKTRQERKAIYAEHQRKIARPDHTFTFVPAEQARAIKVEILAQRGEEPDGEIDNLTIIVR